LREERRGRLKEIGKGVHLLSDLMKNRSYLEVKREIKSGQAGELKRDRPVGSSRRLEREREYTTIQRSRRVLEAAVTQR